MTEVKVPTLGESETEATVATWFKQPGDSVAVDEMLCELETDKVSVEVPSPVAGTMGDIVANAGDTVEVGALLAHVNDGAAAAPAPAEPAEAPAAAPAASAGGDATDIMVPALGESVSEATVGTWYKNVGDTVSADEMLCELETDKVSVEVPAPIRRHNHRNLGSCRHDCCRWWKTWCHVRKWRSCRSCTCSSYGLWRRIRWRHQKCTFRGKGSVRGGHLYGQHKRHRSVTDA